VGRLWILAVTGAVGCALRVDDLDLDGWTVAQGDCDDLDPALNPKGIDLPQDGVDQDCDGSDVLAEASGLDHSCILEASGSVVCGGDDTRGQLDVPPDAHFVAIAAGDYHTCGLEEDGRVTCWGDDTYGQCDAPQGLRFDKIDAGYNWSIGEGEGGATCWGQCRAVPVQN
jgi:hypothetical protein